MSKIHYGIDGVDLVTIDNLRCILLDYDPNHTRNLKVMWYSEEMENYFSCWIAPDEVKIWFIWKDSTEKQKKQQRLFQKLGSAYRTLHGLDTIFANSVDVLTAQEREVIELAAAKIARVYIPLLKTQMENLK